MPRPHKQGLAFYRKDVDFYFDPDIISLMDKYGPIGVTVYEVVLDFIFRNGYYLECPLEKVAASVQRTIGSRWIRSADLVLQVIIYCASLGLFDRELSSQDVLTSVGIQERFSIATVRNKVDKSKYWLLEKERGAGGSTPQNGVSVTETQVSATETQVSATEIQQNKIKENKRKSFIKKDEKPRMGNFDTDEFFNKAGEASYKKILEKEKEKGKNVSG